MDEFILPAGLDDARNLALQSERTEAKTANAELAQEGAGTTAKLAAVVLAGLELRLFCVFDAFCGSCHNLCSLSLLQTLLIPVRGRWAWLRELCADAEGHTEALEQSAGSVVVSRSRDNGDVHTLELVDLGIVDLGEDQLIAQAKRVVAAPIEAF
jgi:hypothetical protein